MNNTIPESKIKLPPAFMATTRQKILLKEHTLPHSFFEIEHPRTMNVLHSISDFTKEVVNLAKRG